MGNEELPDIRNFSYDCRFKKNPVPSVNEKPIQGLSSNKNFIVSNAIENILSVAKRAPDSINWVKKKDYGKIPSYVEKVKENIDHEYKMLQRLHEEHQEKKQCLSEM